MADSPKGLNRELEIKTEEGIYREAESLPQPPINTLCYYFVIFLVMVLPSVVLTFTMYAPDGRWLILV